MAKDLPPNFPTFDKMMWPTLRALIQLGGSGTNQEIDKKVIELANYPESMQIILHGEGPQTEIEYRLQWSRTYLKKVGAIENSARGIWAITEVGRALREQDLASIPATVRSMFSGRGDENKSDQQIEDTSIIDNDIVSPGWRDQLLSVLQSIPPDRFERLCQRLLREEGFVSVEVLGKTGDGGIDGVGVLRVSLLNFKVYFQCKRYKGSVGSPVIREFRGAMQGRSDKGLLITTGTFTADAKKEASREGAFVIDLIDGDDLCNLLKNSSLGITTRLVEEVTVEPDWFATI